MCVVWLGELTVPEVLECCRRSDLGEDERGEEDGCPELDDILFARGRRVRGPLSDDFGIERESCAGYA